MAKKHRDQPHPTSQGMPRSGPAAEPTALSGERMRLWLLGALVALFVARPLMPVESQALTRGDGLPWVMLMCLISLAVSAWMLGRPRDQFRWNWLDIAVGGLFFWHTVAAVMAVFTSQARAAINVGWEWLALAIGYFLVRVLYRDQRERRELVGAMMALSLALSAVAFYQVLVTMPETRARWLSDPESVVRAAGFYFQPGTPEWQAFETRINSPEPIATFALTNSLAGFLTPWVVLGVWSLVTAIQSRSHNWGKPAVFLAVVFACLLLTKSRTALLACGVGGLGAALVAGWPSWLARRWKLVLGAGLALVIALAYGVATAGNSSPLAGAQLSVAWRVEYWQATGAMVRALPWFGCGPGNFQARYTQFMLPVSKEEVFDPHNFLMEIAGTAGLPAAALMVAILVLLLCLAFREYRRATAVPTSGAEGESARPAAPPGEPRPRKNPQTLHAAEATARHVVLAVGCGLMAGLVVGWLLGMPGGSLTESILLPVLALAIGWWLSRPWVESGQLPQRALLVAVGASLLNFIAAGGIGVAGVAVTLWLLVGLLDGAEPPQQSSEAPPQPSPAPDEVHALAGLPRWPFLVLAASMALACYWTAYHPVLASQSRLGLATEDTGRKIELLEEAAVEDPFAPEPWLYLADWLLVMWERYADEKVLDEFQSASEEYLRRTPHSSSAYARVAMAYARAAQAAQRRKQDAQGFLSRAAELWRGAVERYPTDANLRAELSVALGRAGDEAGALEEARRAWELDRVTPHEAKKISPELRSELLRNEE